MRVRSAGGVGGIAVLGGEGPGGAARGMGSFRGSGIPETDPAKAMASDLPGVTRGSLGAGAAAERPAGESGPVGRGVPLRRLGRERYGLG